MVTYSYNMYLCPGNLVRSNSGMPSRGPPVDAFLCLFNMILYVPSTIFQLVRWMRSTMAFQSEYLEIRV